MKSKIAVVFGLLAVGLLLGTQASPAKGKKTMSEMKIESTVFKDGGKIPAKYTDEGKDVSPPLEWPGVPTPFLPAPLSPQGRPQPPHPKRKFLAMIGHPIAVNMHSWNYLLCEIRIFR